MHKFRALSSFAMGPIHFETVFQKMVVFAMSRAWQLGRAVDRAMSSCSFLDAIVEQQHGYVLLTGTVGEGYQNHPPDGAGTGGGRR